MGKPAGMVQFLDGHWPTATSCSLSSGPQVIIVTFVSRVQEIYHYDSRLLMIIIMRILIIINNNDKSDKREKNSHYPVDN